MYVWEVGSFSFFGTEYEPVAMTSVNQGSTQHAFRTLEQTGESSLLAYILEKPL